MTKMDDLLSSLTEDDGIPSDFIDGVRHAYDQDFQGFQAHTNKIQGELDTERAARAQEVTNLKAHNYELFMSSPRTDGDAGIDNNVDDEEGPSIEALFRKRV